MLTQLVSSCLATSAALSAIKPNSGTTLRTQSMDKERPFMIGTKTVTYHTVMALLSLLLTNAVKLGSLEP